ncbi:uncharacterized protein [Littorina saxatilis]|uniref:uncharacterized protein n=1 Tax=Littorina saxatilis TaxID=31220 RepID=UPI0038B45495
MSHPKMFSRMPLGLFMPLALILLFCLASTGAEPSIGLRDCPADVALDSSSCTCMAENVTSSFSGLLWKDPSGNTLVYARQPQTVATLPFTKVEQNFNGKEYTCEVIDSNHQLAITYTPKVAEAPSALFLKHCPTDYILPGDETASCTCMTTDPGVPAALILWEDPQRDLVTFTKSETSLNLFFRDVKANFSDQAYHCVLRHITGDLTVSYTPLLVVSPEAPEIEGLNGSYTTGENVKLKCTVRGGIPETQNIFFNCPNHPDQPDKIEDSQLTSSLTFQAQISDNNTQCYCYGTNDFVQSSSVSFALYVGIARDPAFQPLLSLQNCTMYVVNNASSCTCVAENLGNSNSVLLWKDPDGQSTNVNAVSNTSIRLTLGNVDAKFNKQRYQCELLHGSEVQKIFYTINIAEPPSPPYLKECPAAEGLHDPNANCTCVTSRLGEPAALFVWDDPDQNAVVFTKNETSLTLSFAALNETYRGQAYRCILRHITGDLGIEYTPPKPFEVPSAPFLKHCPTDYIMPEDDTATCTCMTTDPGVPAAGIVWLDPQQNTVTFTTSETSLNLFFRDVKANFSDQAYHCVLRHITGDLTVSYTPLLVVSPEAPKIEGLNGSYTTGENVKLKCTVRGGVPETQNIFFNCPNHPDQPDKIADSQLTSSLTFQAQISDNNTQCYCYGTNDFVQSSSVSFALYVGIVRDPAFQPLLSLQNCTMYVVNKASSCTCVAENLGNSNSVLLWKDPDGQTTNVNDVSNPSIRLTLGNVDPKFNKQRYQCELLHGSEVQRIFYTINIAEPPSPPYLKECPAAEGSHDPNANCTCVTSRLGEPAALFVWDDPDHNAVVFTRTETTLALPFAALNETYRGQAYRCILRHITGDLGIEYTPPKPFEAAQGEEDDGLSGGAIAGIVIAVIVIVAIVIGVVCWRKRRY